MMRRPWSLGTPVPAEAPGSGKRHADSLKNLVIVLVLLVIADGLISQFITGAGAGREANPFLRIFIGGDRFMVLKVCGGILAGILLIDFHRRHPGIARASAVLFVALYTAVLYWNLGIAFFAA
jgi:hypothetical protein